MPELPEVETLNRELTKVLKDKKIKNSQVLWAKTVLPLSSEEFSQQIINKKIKGTSRRAKILIIDFFDSTALAIHLKMTGQLIFVPTKGKKIVGGHPDKTIAGEQPNKFTRLILEFSDHSKLYFNDLRKFGWVRLVDDKQLKDLTKKIGLEPLSKIFTEQALSDIFKRFPNRTIKQILMDQTLIAGIGNIYADESCFTAKLMPNRIIKTLNKKDIERLHSAIKDILKLAVQKKGTSFRDYRRADGAPGGFVPYLKVYGRPEQPCKICNQPIQKIKHNGRGTHFCKHCQK